MSVLRPLIVGILAAIGGIAVNLLTEFVPQGLPNRWLAPAIIGAILGLTVLVSAVLQRAPTSHRDPREELVNQLRQHRAALQQLNARCQRHDHWTTRCIEDWEQHQREIAALKAALRKAGVPAVDEPLDTAPAPGMGCLMRAALVAKHTTALLAIPLVAFTVGLYAPRLLVAPVSAPAQIIAIARVASPPQAAAIATYAPAAGDTPTPIATATPRSAAIIAGPQPTAGAAGRPTRTPRPLASAVPTEDVAPGQSAGPPTGPGSSAGPPTGPGGSAGPPAASPSHRPGLAPVSLVMIVWLACAAGAAILAERRGRNVVGWTVAGVFLGPFALLAVAILPANVPPGMQAAPRAVPPSWSVNPYPATMQGIPHAPAPVAGAAPAAAAPAPAAPAPAATTCPSCSGTVRPQARFCPHCGKALPAAPPHAGGTQT